MREFLLLVLMAAIVGALTGAIVTKVFFFFIDGKK